MSFVVTPEVSTSDNALMLAAVILASALASVKYKFVFSVKFAVVKLDKSDTYPGSATNSNALPLEFAFTNLLAAYMYFNRLTFFYNLSGGLPSVPRFVIVTLPWTLRSSMFFKIAT